MAASANKQRWRMRDRLSEGASELLVDLSSGPMAISKELLEILVCPVCRTPVQVLDDQSGLRCATCHVVYPIRDDIPVMLADEARKE